MEYEIAAGNCYLCSVASGTPLQYEALVCRGKVRLNDLRFRMNGLRLNGLRLNDQGLPGSGFQSDLVRPEEAEHSDADILSAGRLSRKQH